MKNPRYIAIAVICLVFLVIFLQNTGDAQLQILFWDIRMSRILFFPFLFLAGFATGFIAAKLTGSRDDKD